MNVGFLSDPHLMLSIKLPDKDFLHGGYRHSITRDSIFLFIRIEIIKECWEGCCTVMWQPERELGTDVALLLCVFNIFLHRC